MERYREQVLEEMPEVDAVLGTGSYGDIVSAVEKVAAGQAYSHFTDINAPVEELPRVISTPMHYAYLRIAEGCSNRCAYCVIPSCGASTAAAGWRTFWPRPRRWRTAA